MRTARIATAHARRIAASGPRSTRLMASEAAGGGGGGGGGFGTGFLLGAAVGGAGYYAYANGLIDMSLTGTTERKPAVDYAKVREDIAGILDENAEMGPTLVRLAWHSAGTYDKETDTGGSNGATMRFQPEADHGANAGLHLARGALEPVKAKHPGMSHADLYTLAGVVAVEEMGGPEVPWRPGRTDAATGDACPPDGRLPDASKDENHIRAIFGRMGFSDREMVALTGAHSLGRCHTDRSGYDGPWTRAPTTFSNLYFTELRDTKWSKRKWSGPEQYENPEKDLMMLPTDIALWKDKTFREWVLKYADDEELFFQDFAAAFSKLLELGVKFPEDQQQQQRA